jgi:uncharacterized protein
MTKISLSVFALLIGTSFAAQSAGFDCSLAKTKIEKIICSDAELSELDSQLKDVFIEAQGETAGVDAESGERVDPVAKENLNWLLTVRNKCSNASCLKTAYKTHIKQIQKTWLPSESCEIEEMLKDKLETKIIQHKDVGGYESAVIKKAGGSVKGEITNDRNWDVHNVAGEVIAAISYDDLTVFGLSDSCKDVKMKLKKVGNNKYQIFKNNTLTGEINGRLPKE